MDPRLTRVVKAGPQAAELAAKLLCAGDIVAIPTETVYGLAASAFDEAACRRIFEAKGRPQDNPLIVHVADQDMLALVCEEVPPDAVKLINAFWPGPLSIVLKKSRRIPDTVSAGLPTVAVRMPASRAARDIIRAAGVPVAAPSANRSGRPSPTSAEHVLCDMAGRIPLVVDGGACSVGVESTVVDVTGTQPIVLRPGGIRMEQVRAVTGSAAAAGQPAGDAAPMSPGVKYKHYSPRAMVHVFTEPDSVQEILAAYDTSRTMGLRPVILCPQSDLVLYKDRHARSLGNGSSDAERAIFAELRSADERRDDLILIEYTDAMGEAVKDRITRAADRCCHEAVTGEVKEST